MRENLKVAIVQDYIRYGGRFMVIASMIEALNKLNIKPDVLSFVSDISTQGVKEKYQSELKFYGITVPFNLFSKMTEFRKIWFNLIVSARYAKKYDLIINNNNSAIFLPSNGVVNYFHFPRYDRILKREFFQTHKNALVRTRLVVWIDYWWSGFLYKVFPTSRKHIQLANSYFTKLRLSQVHNILAHQIDVLYPPVVEREVDEYQLKKKEGFVISVGRFSQTKDQLLQLKIAKEIPELNFKLVGFSKSKNDYLDECYTFIREEQISNVELLVNIPYSELQLELRRAKFFLHTTFEEPFGITPAQAISKNCIPVVPNSGGPIEIVPIRNFRFHTKEEAIEIIKRLNKIDDHSSQLSKLKDNLKSFSKDEFIKKFNTILKNQILNNGCEDDKKQAS